MCQAVETLFEWEKARCSLDFDNFLQGFIYEKNEGDYLQKIIDFQKSCTSCKIESQDYPNNLVLDDSSEHTNLLMLLNHIGAENITEIFVANKHKTPETSSTRTLRVILSMPHGKITVLTGCKVVHPEYVKLAIKSILFPILLTGQKQKLQKSWLNSDECLITKLICMGYENISIINESEFKELNRILGVAELASKEDFESEWEMKNFLIQNKVFFGEPGYNMD